MSDVLSSARLMPMDAAAPIGIFDSGVGGLSVLRHVRAALPQEQLLYFADSGYAPYGDKREPQIVTRSLAVAGFLVAQGIKALVVACNTATAAAIEAIRQQWPALLVVGIEPGLKPAALHSKSGIVGVLATRSTLASARFMALREQIVASGATRFLSQPCVGLVEQIEKGELQSPATAALVDRYVMPLIGQGADTLVLGCTHYPFVRDLIEASARQAGCAAPLVIDTGEAVTRQLSRLLERHQLRYSGARAPVQLIAYTTASVSSLSTVLAKLLKIPAEVREIAAQTAIAAD
jgi:glutamate racemase